MLIDGDMRNPSIHRQLNLSNARGLSDALTGFDDFSKLIQNGNQTGFSVITSGTLPPNPAEILSGNRLEMLVTKLLTHYDHVIIDGPPVMGMADALLIATSVEATIFVIAAQDTRAKGARVALRRLTDTRAYIPGAILTKFNARNAGYGYDYAYSYTYGAKEPKGVKSFFKR